MIDIVAEKMSHHLLRREERDGCAVQQLPATVQKKNGTS